MKPAHIRLENVSVSYFLRGKVPAGVSSGSASVGGEIVARGRLIEIRALRDVTMSVVAGERIGLIGRNGAGKSTLLKLCAGALSAQKGTIDIAGKVSPQFALGAGIKAGLSGRQNAELKGLYLGVSQRRLAEHIEAVKELSGLESYFELPVETYSAGMRSRLVMSIMHLMRGDILIMDEWINAADATVNETVNRLQTKMIEQAEIILLASHSEKVLKQWTNRCIWFEHGRILADGPTEDIVEQYKKAGWKARRAAKRLISSKMPQQS